MLALGGETGLILLPGDMFALMPAEELRELLSCSSSTRLLLLGDWVISDILPKVVTEPPPATTPPLPFLLFGLFWELPPTELPLVVLVPLWLIVLLDALALFRAAKFEA